jgi:hypothetical protein
MDSFWHALSTPIAGIFDLVGPDSIMILLILLILVFTAAPIVAIVLLITYLSRRKSPQRPPPLPTAASSAEQLREMEQPKQQNVVSDTPSTEPKRNT